ncbi:GNAT family N-acetyltransferase [Wukongibacter baidiensis]|uniref:GNAT family N-acetyltransferase n=1 Tax=Wukongibacter baidiensis TaxID=1723361 RepID=UPI003D7F6BF2
MIRIATSQDLNDIMIIVDEIKEEVKITDILKWDDEYPTREDFQRDMDKKTLYITEEEVLKGFMCANKHEHEEFKDVKWSNNDGIIVHRLGIGTKYRNLKRALELLEYADELAIKDGCRYLKTCIYEKNYKSQNLFKKAGYTYVGDISLEEYEGKFYCYEKFVK